MTQDEYGYVAAALDLSYEEAETLRKSEVRTPSEQHALRKFHLTRLYGVGAAAVTPEFVCVYGSTRVQNIYRNLLALRCLDGETIRQACERRLRVYCGGGAIARFDTQYEKMSTLTHARLLHETLGILEHFEHRHRHGPSREQHHFAQDARRSAARSWGTFYCESRVSGAPIRCLKGEPHQVQRQAPSVPATVCLIDRIESAWCNGG